MVTQAAKRKSVPAPRKIDWLPAVALFLLTVVTYFPSMTNGFIWDDPQYIVDNPTLKTAGGLWSIWTDPLALPQYYPMVHTTFWIEARFWGTDSAPGYHVDNILLHALAAVLLWRALSSLQIPWPWLAAAVFAVHPVMVESVTWVTERKNVLSIVFYLLAFLAYQRSAKSRQWYIASLVFFLLALFSKTVTCSLPAAILLIQWWKHDRITWRDVRPLLPMFAMGFILSAVTSHLEHSHVGARGPDFNWTPIDRCLIAGRALCFYAVKLVWPHPLMFMYPRWDLHADRAFGFIYPAIAVAAVMGLWLLRRRIGRGPLTAILFFCGTLFPALGFVNVYPMRYSYVADHFQYLAAIGVIVLIIAMLQRAVTVGIRAQRVIAAQRIIALLILSPLVWMTWQQQHIYRNRRTLFQNTIDQNETCWMAHVNLAAALRDDKEPDAAMVHTLRAYQLAPTEADTNYDVGVALAQQLKWKQAIAMFRKATDCDSDCAPAWSYLARALWEHGDVPQDQVEALADAEKANQLMPNLPDPHYVFGRYAELRGDLPTAIAEYEKILLLNDKDFYAHVDLGNCLQATHRFGEAAGEYQRAIAIKPTYAPAWANLGAAYMQVGQPAQAIPCFDHALQIDPTLQPARQGLTAARKAAGQ